MPEHLARVTLSSIRYRRFHSVQDLHHQIPVSGREIAWSCCSIVSLTSGPISRAQAAKKVLGWFSAVHSMVCRPLSLQVFARSSKKPAEKVWREPAGLPGKPEGLPDTPLGKGFLTTRDTSSFMLVYVAICTIPRRL